MDNALKIACSDEKVRDGLQLVEKKNNNNEKKTITCHESLSSFQEWCEGLAEVLWTLRTQVKQLEILWYFFFYYIYDTAD